jgi:hypothetical protein
MRSKNAGVVIEPIANKDANNAAAMSFIEPSRSVIDTRRI